MPSIFDRLKRKEKTEVNVFTGEKVPVHVITAADIQTFETQPVKVVYEDRLAVAARWGIRAVAIITTAFNFLMLLGYLTSVNIPFAIVFFFSTYFSLAYLKRRHTVDTIRNL